MKHVFIVNPHSGKQELKKDLFEQLKNYNGKIECEVVKFKDREETINFIKEYCSKSEDDIVFCACGGDGTINAVVNAVMGFKNAIVTCYPCGSGNDFVKIFNDNNTSIIITIKKTRYFSEFFLFCKYISIITNIYL
jgi:diacylglycerol kinase family enzyme